ncbi:unnamed protein product [Leptidea sinapis]|uniref:ZAD domain-containing protein n=1 Tax=Leptidea sinapis TaxID=189913 RepID=A0A5E4QJ02_9NEOP|nr:unnamed protein product [Leptidea sinapis]
MDIIMLCKICLEKTGNISILSKGDDGIQYNIKLIRVLKVKEEDILPSVVCEQCVSDLDIAYRFVQKYDASVQTLKCLNSSIHLYSDIQLKNEARCDIENESNELKSEELSDDHDYPNDFDNDLLSEFQSRTIFENNGEPVTQTHESVRKKVRKREGKNRVQCVICGLITLSPSALEIHMRKHTGERPFSCDLCHSRYSTKGALKRHLERASIHL